MAYLTDEKGMEKLLSMEVLVDGEAAEMRRCPEAYIRLGLAWKTTRGGIERRFHASIIQILNLLLHDL